MRLEPLCRRFELAALPLRTEFRIDDRAFMTIRIAEMHAGLWRAIQLVPGCVVAEIVASIIGEPQLPGRRMPVETDGVAHAAREHFLTRTIWLDAHDGRVWIAAIAHIA